MNWQPLIVTTIAVVGCLKLLIDAVLAIGRWTKKVETLPEQRTTKVSLERLSWDIEQLTKQISEWKNTSDGRFTELAGRQSADHQLLREVLNWKAGIYSELAVHFYSIPFVDRIVKESERDRAALWADVGALKAEVHARRSGDTVGP